MVQSNKSGRWPRLSKRTTAVIALMESGVSDYKEISRAVGLPLEQVEQIGSKDPSKRRQLARNIPDDFAFRLRKNVSCPVCGFRIFIVPCLKCRIREQ